MQALEMQQGREEDCKDVAYDSPANVQDNLEGHIQLLDGVAHQHYHSDVKSFAKADVIFGIVLDIEQLEYTNSNEEKLTLRP